MTVEELISKVFATRNAVHLEHWRTQSYAQHMALGDFYEGLPGAIDSIVEKYQGAFQLIGPVPVPVPPTDAMLDHLEDEAAWIEANRDRISKRNSALGNLIDALLETYYGTIYKLRNLK